MTKKWMATGKRDGRTIRIYVTTSTELIESDLNVPEARSLIASGRHLNSRNDFSNDTNHHDFAVGAFDAYAHSHNLSLENLELTDTIPEALSGVAIGGDGNTFLLTVYEE